MNFTKSLLSLLLCALALQPMQSQSMQKYLTAAATTAALGTATYFTTNKAYFNSIHWDWENINPLLIGKQSITEFLKNHAQHLNNLQEQNQWLWGAATSAHQVESNCTNNQWNLFVGQELDGKITEPAGLGCDAQNHEDEDIKLMKEFGLNSYRFSIEWSKIYPKQGEINKEELLRYKRFCKKLVANGIQPVVTLYHYTEPIWFYELGGFEKAENIKYFVEFCTTVYKEMHQEVYLWLTFNAPEGIALQGWLTGSKPPAKKNMMNQAVEVLHNILEAHVAVYRAIKALPEGKNSRVGILKNILQLDPWDICNPLDHLACMFGNRLQNESVYNFLTTGEYTVNIPFKVNYRATNNYIKNGGKCLDFIGLNYYCHNYMKLFKTIREPNPEIEIPTNNERYTIYGEGLNRALHEISDRIAKPLGIPIYITENGVATDNDEAGNALRTLHNQRYIYAVARAIDEGIDVRGYIHWSLMDNYEWGVYKKFYGLYHVDRSTPELKRSLKDGAQYYQSVVLGSRIEPKKDSSLRGRL